MTELLKKEIFETKKVNLYQLNQHLFFMPWTTRMPADSPEKLQEPLGFRASSADKALIYLKMKTHAFWLK